MIRHVLTALVLAASGLPATAQQVPFIADVSGVATDDTLNVRENPRGSAPSIGALAPDAKGIEVVGLSESGDWAQINFGEGSGWVARRFLEAEPEGAFGETYLDRPLHCSGTEPFWTLTAAGGDGPVAYTPLDGAALTLTPELRLVSSNVGGSAQLLEATSADGARATGVLRRQHCTDGMSDRAFGLSLDLLLKRPDGASLLSGCCSLIAR